MSKARDRSSKQDGASAVASAAQNNFGPPPTPSAFARTMSVFRREFAAYFATPVAAVFIVMFVAIAALLGVALLGVLPGILIAIMLSILNVFRRVWWPHQAELGRVEGQVDLHPRRRRPTMSPLG